MTKVDCFHRILKLKEVLGASFLVLSILGDALAQGKPMEASASVEVRCSVGRQEERWVEEIRKDVAPTDKGLANVRPLSGVVFKKNGVDHPLERPVLLNKEGVWVGLKALCNAQSLTFITSSRDTFTLIRSDGLPLEMKSSSRNVLVNRMPFLILNNPPYRYKQEPYIEVKDLNKLFDGEFIWDISTKSLSLQAPKDAGAFQVFQRPKPPREAKERLEVSRPPISPAVEAYTEKRLMPTPTEVLPDVKLHVTHYATYDHSNLTKNRIRSYGVNTGGIFYDYKLDSYLRWLDRETGTLVNDGKYIGLYGEDHWIRALDLNANLYPLRSQGQGYEGFSFTQFHEPFNATYYGGRYEISVPGPADVGTVKYFGKIAGIQHDMKLGFLDLTTDAVFLYNEAEDESKSGRVFFPRRNLVLKEGATTYLPFGMKLAGHGAISNYNPDILKEQVIRDYDWLVQAELKRELFALGYLYEYVGTDYASFSFPANYQDYKGHRINFSFTPLRYFSLSSLYNVSQNNVDGLASQPTTDNNSIAFSMSLTLPENSNIGITWDRSYTDTTGPGQAYVEPLGSNSYNTRLTYSKAWGQNTSLYGSYSRSYTDYFGSDSDSWYDRYEVSVYKFIPRFKGSYIRFRHLMQKNWYMASGNFTTVTNNSTLGARFYPVSQFYVYSDLNVNATGSENIRDTALLDIKAGANLALTNDIQFGVDWTFNAADLNHFSNKAYNNWSLFFKGTLGFDVGLPEKWSRVSGSVFMDSNVNGIRDGGEEGLEGVVIIVPDELRARTDKTGNYYIRHMTPGTKTLKLDDKTLPFGVMAYGPNEFTFEAGARKAKRFDFPLYRVSSIGGRLYMDENKNDAYDIGEEGIENVIVYLNENFKWTTTDVNGKFLFEVLPPGKYAITIEKKDISKDYNISGIKTIALDLKEGEKVENISIPIQKKEIVKKVF